MKNEERRDRLAYIATVLEEVSVEDYRTRRVP